MTNKIGKCKHLAEGSGEFTDVVGNVFREIRQDIVGHGNVACADVVAQDIHASIVTGGPKLGDNATGEAGHEALSIRGSAASVPPRGAVQ